jgi:hypothetical protein
MSKIFRPRSFAMIILVLILAAAVYGFAASNTVPATTYAGYGSGTISGYTITTVRYRLNAVTPLNIDQTTFTISPTSATSVYVALENGGTWYSCANAAGSVTCAVNVPAVDADLLQISAAE